MAPDTRIGSAPKAILAVSRLLSLAVEQGPEGGVPEALVREARALFGVRCAVLIELGERERSAWVRAADPANVAPAATMVRALEQLPAIAELIVRRLRSLALDGDRGRAALEEVGCSLEPPARSTLLLPLRRGGEITHVLALADDSPDAWTGGAAEMPSAFAAAAAAALAQLQLGDTHERELARNSALTRAAKTLNESLDLPVLLSRISQEASTILNADVAAVYRGDAGEGLTVAATWGFPPETVGYQLEPGAGLSGRVVDTGKPMLTNDYQRIAAPQADSPFARVQSCMAVPLVWDNALRGVLSVGYERRWHVSDEDLELLATFGELAAVACANASAHAGLALAARTDALTGCLNHAALHEGLMREIDRCERGAAQSLSLVLLDLDDFKQVNDEHGHLLGDEVLRRVGRSMRSALRPYDLAARYGGDEFAIVTVEADEACAVEIAERAIDRRSEAIGDIGAAGPRATAGVAEWSPGVNPTELIARADRALLFGKQEGVRGVAHAFGATPELFRPGRFARREDRGLPEPPPMPPVSSHWPDPGEAIEERLRKRSRQLALANALGARLAAMTEAQAIMDAAAEELHRAFGYYLVSVVRVRPDDRVEAAALRGEAFERLLALEWSQSRDEGLIGRCLRERRPVLANDVRAEPDYGDTSETGSVQSELVVPLWVGTDLWGVINIEDDQAGAFDEDDLRLVETVADQVGSALRSAFLYEQLEQAYNETAEALAAALEAKDADAARRTQELVANAQAVGLRLGLDDVALRDLRFGAVFHDIGKIAVPEAILTKQGPLDEAERAQVERHVLVGEQILKAVDFLSGARRLVRHEHERWDGLGYPDGLAGDDIPLGSRIILACDALGAMTSDRPYRPAMTLPDACAELRRCAGTQFDPAVVDVLLELIERDESGVRPAERPAARPGT